MTLVENKKAHLVVIGHNIDPTELVVLLSDCVIRGKARLGWFIARHALLWSSHRLTRMSRVPWLSWSKY